MAQLGARIRVGASATDRRRPGPTQPASYSPPSTGPAGPWPVAGHAGGAGYTPEAKTLLVLTVAEIAAIGGLRHLFRRHHGG